MADLYVYNATSQIQEVYLSIADVVTRTGKTIPPGSQAHFTADATTITNMTTRLKSQGVVDHSTIASPAAFKGVSLLATPISINNIGAPIV